MGLVWFYILKPQPVKAMISDPAFLSVAIPAVLLMGLTKGGFCGPLTMLGVPIMALVISPVQAAAIFLPILLLMDLIALYSYRGQADWTVLVSMLPAAILGVVIGWLVAGFVSEEIIRLIVGLTALAFVGDYCWRQTTRKPLATRGKASAAIWGGAAGFTSFIAHAGGPPYQIHTLPLKMHPVRFAATNVHFFAIVNGIKLVPYFALGQFSTENLTITATLLPLAPLATLLGVYLVKTLDQKTFYRLTYIAMFIIAIKLCWDSVAAIATSA